MRGLLKSVVMCGGGGGGGEGGGCIKWVFVTPVSTSATCLLEAEEAAAERSADPPVDRRGSRKC